MSSFEVYPVIEKNKSSVYGLFVVNTKCITEIARYDAENDELIVRDVAVNIKRFSLNKIVNDFIKESQKFEQIKEEERFKNI